MNESRVEGQLPGINPLKENEKEKETEETSVADTKEDSVFKPNGDPTLDNEQELYPTLKPLENSCNEVEEELKPPGGGDPPMDWFEPLEDDDYEDDESLAGESERSEDVTCSEKLFTQLCKLRAPRRRRAHVDEDWIEWPTLGEGWKRREVVRRSGSSIGQKDVYYMSPNGDRVRSRVELSTILQGFLDLSHFEYKSGKFYDREAPPIRVRARAKRKPRERSSSESSFMEREGADTPDSFCGLTPTIGSKNSNHNQTSGSLNSRQSNRVEELHYEDKIKLPVASSSRSLVLSSINGETGTEDSVLSCAKCGRSFIGSWYDKQRKRPCCRHCWATKKTRVHPLFRLRKVIPCGECVACHNDTDCGECANCKNGLQGPEQRRRTCCKRKCLCPVRKDTRSVGFEQNMPYADVPETFDDNSTSQPSQKNSDTENFSVNVDLDDDDMSTDDDDDWHKKRKRRSCGECKACLCRKDCGTCDFCFDKPKFGGSNKKRQKCRLRQCQRQAMRHLLPYQMGQMDFGLDAAGPLGRSRPHYTYSRKSKKNKVEQNIVDLTDEDDESLQPNGHPNKASPIGSQSQSEQQRPNRSTNKDVLAPIEDDDDLEEDDEDEADYDDEDFPMITQICSLADNTLRGGSDGEKQLLKLLEDLRSSTLPILWYAIAVDGPQLQLIQCSKESSMADTTVLIDPGFCYQVAVQRQPLLPTHSLYDSNPSRLSSVSEVVKLLLGLERYNICQGIPSKQPYQCQYPIILERASTCHFLVRKNQSVCANCLALE